MSAIFKDAPEGSLGSDPRRSEAGSMSVPDEDSDEDDDEPS